MVNQVSFSAAFPKFGKLDQAQSHAVGKIKEQGKYEQRFRTNHANDSDQLQLVGAAVTAVNEMDTLAKEAPEHRAEKDGSPFWQGVDKVLGRLHDLILGAHAAEANREPILDAMAKAPHYVPSPDTFLRLLDPYQDARWSDPDFDPASLKHAAQASPAANE